MTDKYSRALGFKLPLKYEAEEEIRLRVNNNLMVTRYANRQLLG